MILTAMQLLQEARSDYAAAYAGYKDLRDDAMVASHIRYHAAVMMEATAEKILDCELKMVRLPW